MGTYRSKLIDRPANRGIDTLLPMSQQFRMPIVTVPVNKPDRVLQKVQVSRNYGTVCGKTVLVAWHQNGDGLENVAKELVGPTSNTAAELPKWSSTDFDSVWVFDGGGRSESFFDSENGISTRN